MKHWLIILSLLLLGSCVEEEEIITLDVSQIKLVDRGRISHQFSFEGEIVGDSITAVRIRTMMIKKGDSINYINASLTGKDLRIDIASTPYDFYCNEDTCFTVHDVYFNLNLAKIEKYDIDLRINNGVAERGIPYYQNNYLIE